MWRNWQTRCFQRADVGGSNPLMGIISGCSAIGSMRDLGSRGCGFKSRHSDSPVPQLEDGAVSKTVIT